MESQFAPSLNEDFDNTIDQKRTYGQIDEIPLLEKQDIRLVPNTFCPDVGRLSSVVLEKMYDYSKFLSDTSKIDQIKIKVAIPPGLEPGTLCLEGRCSIQLSYGTDQLRLR